MRPSARNLPHINIFADNQASSEECLDLLTSVILTCFGDANNTLALPPRSFSCALSASRFGEESVEDAAG